VPCHLVSGCVTPPIWFLSISPRVCSTLPSDPVSRRRPGASLSLRLYPTGKRTFTSKLCNMLGTHACGQARAFRASSWSAVLGSRVSLSASRVGKVRAERPKMVAGVVLA
jgi:hypothetical protein